MMVDHDWHYLDTQGLPPVRHAVLVSYVNGAHAPDLALAYWTGSCWLSTGGLGAVHGVYAWTVCQPTYPPPQEVARAQNQN